MHKLLVCLKRVVDYNVRIRVEADGSGVATEGLKMSINPFDEIALEEALRLREAGEASEIVAVTVGGPESEQQLRTGLAMGADRAIRIATETAPEALTVARALLEVTRREEPGMVLLGKQAIDDDQNQVGQMLAALWQRPQATFVSAVALADGRATVTREVDAGLETLEVDLPCVITTDLRLNEPRYVKLPEILKAKHKPLEVLDLSGLGIEPSTQFRVVSTQPPAPRAPGKRVADVTELVAELRQRGVL